MPFHVEPKPIYSTGSPGRPLYKFDQKKEKLLFPSSRLILGNWRLLSWRLLGSVTFSWNLSPSCRYWGSSVASTLWIVQLVSILRTGLWCSAIFRLFQFSPSDTVSICSNLQYLKIERISSCTRWSLAGSGSKLLNHYGFRVYPKLYECCGWHGQRIWAWSSNTTPMTLLWIWTRPFLSAAQ